MSDNQIIEYCKKLIRANLNQYMETNPKEILYEVYRLDNDKNNELLLEHCRGVKELLEKCIDILEKK